MKTRISILVVLIAIMTIVGMATIATATDPYVILKKINNTTTPTYAPVSDDGYDELINNTMGNDQDWNSFSLPGIMDTLMSPGADLLGPFFWIIVFGAIGTFIYIKTDSVIIPGALFLIGSGLIGPMLLPEFTGIIWGIVIVGFAGLGYVLFRSR